jgi:hypothetical protein
MLLLCWNVAAWGTTLPQIRTHYKTLEAYLDRHGADIFCIQARMHACRRVLTCAAPCSASAAALAR